MAAKMTNKRVVEIAEFNDLSSEVRRHVLRREGVNDYFTGIGVDTRRSEGEKETEHHLVKDCRKKEKHGRVEELECGKGGGWQQRMLGGQCVGLMRLLALSVSHDNDDDVEHFSSWRGRGGLTSDFIWVGEGLNRLFC